MTPIFLGVKELKFIFKLKNTSKISMFLFLTLK